MLLAFVWWAMLLHIKNNDAFLAKKELLQRVFIDNGSISQPQDLYFRPEFLSLKNKYDHQEMMIYGEGLVFVFSLFFGIYMINLGYKSKVDSEKQTRNFLLSITHELKSPLTSIRLALETIQKRDLDNEKKIKLCSNGIEESDRLINLVNDLLLAARVESSYKPLLEKIDIQEKISLSVQSCKQRCPDAVIEWEPNSRPIFIMADDMGIRSAIDNLIDNALKYSFQSKYLKISIAENDDKVIIRFADHGIGISDEFKRKIFDKFYRVGSEDTRKTKGTGLGLFIVSEIVRIHHGKINVSNNLPKGSIFEITLPQQKS
jgi:signal transduction histidine kinase